MEMGVCPEEAPDQADTANACLKVLAPMIKTAEFYSREYAFRGKGRLFQCDALRG